MKGVALRRSPVRTRAMLAANRANAQKSTGPSTPESKARVALSALRHGVNAPGFLSTLGKSARAREEYKELYLALYAALLPDKTDQTAVDLLQRTALHVWTLKQRVVRWAASRAERDAWFAKPVGYSRLPCNYSSGVPGGGCASRSGYDGEEAGATVACCRRVQAGRRGGRGCTSW
jgi:hypothetical protein